MAQKSTFFKNFEDEKKNLKGGRGNSASLHYVLNFCIFFLFLRPMCKSYVYLTRKILIGGGYHMECRKMVTTI